MTRKCFGLLLAIVAIFLLTVADKTKTQEVPAKRPTMDELAKDNNLFLSLSRKALKWDWPAEPIKIVGPLYFVGTPGIGFISVHHTGKAGYFDEHRHADFRALDYRFHSQTWFQAGRHPHHHQWSRSLRPCRSVCRTEETLRQQKSPLWRPMSRPSKMGVKTISSTGADWKIMGFPPAKVDRVLRDGDTVKLGEIVLTAHHTPGPQHPGGSTTWTTILAHSGKAYTVVFPDGSEFNPGYRLAESPPHPGIGDDYRRTLHQVKMLKPDIWLAHHTEYFDLEWETSARQDRRRQHLDLS